MLARLLTGLAALLLWCAPAAAEEPIWSVDSALTVDSFMIAGGAPNGSETLTNLDFAAKFTPASRGPTFAASLLHNMGGSPGSRTGSLTGLDNIEVEKGRLKVFELSVEQPLLGAGRVKAGAFDLNSEFSVADASDLLIGAPFGVGPEFAASGPQGPSIFPATGLGVMGVREWESGAQVRGAVMSARTGLKLRLNEGVLFVAEAGWTGRARIAAGAWRYSKRQPDPADGRNRVAQGVYALADVPIARIRGRDITLFARGGIAAPSSGPFRASWQAGAKLPSPVPGRDRDTLSIGIHKATTTRSWRIATGPRSAKSEWGVELTYQMALGEHFAIQPDLQLRREAEGRGKLVYAAGLRFVASWSRSRARASA